MVWNPHQDFVATIGQPPTEIVEENFSPATRARAAADQKNSHIYFIKRLSYVAAKLSACARTFSKTRTHFSAPASGVRSRAFSRDLTPHWHATSGFEASAAIEQYRSSCRLGKTNTSLLPKYSGKRSGGWKPS